MNTIDKITENYINLSLKAGQHCPYYVDSYYDQTIGSQNQFGAVVIKHRGWIWTPHQNQLKMPFILYVESNP